MGGEDVYLHYYYYYYYYVLTLSSAARAYVVDAAERKPSTGRNSLIYSPSSDRPSLLPVLSLGDLRMVILGCYQPSRKRDASLDKV
jgi:hypothetical protein